MNKTGRRQKAVSTNRKAARAPVNAKRVRQQARNADLARSGLCAKDAKEAGMKTMSGEVAKRKLGFSGSKMNLLNCYSIPNFDIDGKEDRESFRVRVLGDYQIRDSKTGKYRPGPKYWQRCK